MTWIASVDRPPNRFCRTIKMPPLRRGYLRCRIGCHKKGMPPAPFRVPPGLWQQLHDKGENPATAGCWDSQRSWRCSRPPRFVPSVSARVCQASASDLAAAQVAKVQWQERKEALMTVNTEFNMVHGEYVGDRGWTWKPVPEIRRGGVRAYATGKTPALKPHGRKCVYDDASHYWSVQVGDAWLQSLHGSNALTPAEVTGWEYDDGHYAMWALTERIKFVAIGAASSAGSSDAASAAPAATYDETCQQV